MAPRKQAAVLVPVYRDSDGELRLVLVQRREGGVHGGQLAFPGGVRETSDASIQDAALREACEEIGLAAEAIEVIAELPVIDTITTEFRVHPFLARVTPPRAWRVDEDEIADVLDVRVDDLAQPGARGSAFEKFPTWPVPQKIHFYRVGPFRLWGVTFRILEPLLPRLRAGEWRV